MMNDHPTDGEHRGVVDRRHDHHVGGIGNALQSQHARTDQRALAEFPADAADHRHGLGRVVDRHGAESEVDRRTARDDPGRHRVVFSGRQLQGDRTDQRPLRTPFLFQAGKEHLVVGLDLEGSALDDAPRRSELGLRQPQGAALLVVGRLEHPPVPHSATAKTGRTRLIGKRTGSRWLLARAGK